MNKNIALFLIGAVVVVLGLAGYALSHQSSPNGIGATVNYTNSGGSINLYGEVVGTLNDLAVLRSNLVANTATSSFGTGTLGPMGATTSTTSTSITVASAVFGDGAFCVDAGTSSAYTVLGTAASGTITCQFFNASTTAQAISTGTLTAYRIPAALFWAPTALQTTSSTSN